MRLRVYLTKTLTVTEKKVFNYIIDKIDFVSKNVSSKGNYIYKANIDTEKIVEDLDLKIDEILGYIKYLNNFKCEIEVGYDLIVINLIEEYIQNIDKIHIAINCEVIKKLLYIW